MIKLPHPGGVINTHVLFQLARTRNGTDQPQAFRDLQRHHPDTFKTRKDRRPSEKQFAHIFKFFFITLEFTAKILGHCGIHIKKDPSRPTQPLTKTVSRQFQQQI